MEYEQDSPQPSRPYDIADEERPLATSDSEQPQDGTTLASETSETALMATLQHLIGIVEQLRQDFDTKIKYDTSKERQIDSLHNELQAYRAGLYFKILRPVILDLISMHDDLSRLIEGIPHAEGTIPVAQVLQNLESFQVTIEEILQRNGVEAYSVEGETFVSGKQRALQAVETTESSLDKQIARRVSKGFEYDEKILRPELVMTYRSVSRA
jgi:molecular chaperone GrpE